MPEVAKSFRRQHMNELEHRSKVIKKEYSSKFNQRYVIYAKALFAFDKANADKDVKITDGIIAYYLDKIKAVVNKTIKDEKPDPFKLLEQKDKENKELKKRVYRLQARNINGEQTMLSHEAQD